MRYLKLSITLFSALILATTLPGATALSQSGRGRPKVPQPSSTPSSSQPVVVPAATVVIKQDQAGTTSRFVLHNGMTVVISEQHATPIVAAVACFKSSQFEDWRSNGAADVIQRLILNGTALRPGEHSLVELRALGAPIAAGFPQNSANYSMVVSPARLKEALGIQAGALQNPSLDEEAIRRATSVVLEEDRFGFARGREISSGAFTSRTLTPGNEDAVAQLLSFDDPAACSMTRVIDQAFNGSPASFANPASSDNAVSAVNSRPETTSNSAGVNTPVTMNVLRSITREQVIETYRNRYRPENLIVSVVGDVSTFDTLVMIQQFYGTFGEPTQTPDKIAKVVESPKRAGAPGQRTRPDAQPSENPKSRAEAVTTQTDQAPENKTASGETPQNKLRYAAGRADITQSIVSVAFHVPGTESKDSAAVEVLAALLGQGRGSRLSRSLIDGQMAANRIECEYLAHQKTGLLTMQIWSATDAREGSSIDKGESALFKVIDSVRRELPTEGQMIRAKTVLEKKFLDQAGTFEGRANALAQAEADGRGFRAVVDYRARLRPVTAADVQRVAAGHLTIANASIYEYEPFAAAARTFDSDTFAKTVVTWVPGFAQPVDSASVRPAEAAASFAPVPQGSERSAEQRTMMESVQPLPIRDYSTLNGPKAFVREDHSQPNVTIAILFQGGRVTEDTSTSGTTELMLRSILYGTQRRSFSQTTEELEQLGADVRIVAEPDFFGIVVSVLSRNADRALKLVRDEIEEPAFKDADVARARLGQIASIREARDLSLLRSRELLLEALFPNHPYSLPTHGREEVIASLTSEQLREWHSRVVKRQLPIAIIVGDTNGSALVSAQIAEGFKRRDVDNAAQIKVPQLANPAEKIEQRRREQTTLTVGFAGPKGDTGDNIVLRLIEAAMNLEGGSLSTDLNDKQSMVSAAAFDHAEMFVAGVISASAMTSPANEQRARTALLAQLGALARSGMTASELASARALAATSELAFLQSQPQHALEYARAIAYRLQVADVDDFGARSSKVSADDIKRVASAYFKVAAASSGVVRGTSTTTTPSQPKQD